MLERVVLIPDEDARRGSDRKLESRVPNLGGFRKQNEQEGDSQAVECIGWPFKK